MIRWMCLGLIRFYQLFVSPLKGPSCRFTPTCSQYAHEAIAVYGPVKGLWLGLKRLARCHPFHPGGYDPVIQKQGELHSGRGKPLTRANGQTVSHFRTSKSA